MDKRRAIQILTRAAALYHANLEDQKVIFLYGVPAEIKKQMQAGDGSLLSMKSYEAAFHRGNFLHLTGVRVDGSAVASASHFFEKCLDGRLSQDDFGFAEDGSTAQKLGILENMMGIKRNVAMIGDFTDRGPKLFTEKAAGGVGGLHRIRERPAYRAERAEHAFAKGHQGCHGVPRAEGICRPFQKLYGGTVFRGGESG